MQALLDAIANLPLPSQAQRFFHGRGGLHPGCESWTLDAYPPAWLLTKFDEPASEAELRAIGAALSARWAQIAPPEQVLCWVYQGRQIDEQGGRADTRVMAGALPEPHGVEEAGARYLVHLMRGQNHGLFLDMAAGRAWVRELAAAQPGLKVLNLFAYSCAFSVAALQGGAAEVVNVDMAGGALGTGRRNHELNGLRGASFLAHDVFKSWGKLTRGGPYGLVILDPPSFQRGSFVASKDYGRLLRRLPSLLDPGGHALVCLNTPKLGPDFLLAQMQAEAPELEFVQRLDNPPAFADIDVTRSLKVLVFRHSAVAASDKIQASAPDQEVP